MSARAGLTEAATGRQAGSTPAAGVHLVAGVEVEADLAISVDAGGRGQATAQITGSGQELQVHTDRPEILAAATGRRAGSSVAAALAAAGVRVELHGPRGRLAVLDPDRVTRAGALLGSRHLHLRPAAWTAVARAQIRPVKPVLGGAVVLGAAISAAAAIRLRGRRGRGWRW